MENSTNLKFSKPRFFIILFLILIGVALCIELGIIFYKTNFLETFERSFCNVSDYIDCDGVALTKYSLSFGVPNALWGLILYCVMTMLLFVDRIQAKFKNTIFDVFENPRSYIATLAVLSFAISMILAYISIVEIKKICVLSFCTYFVDLFIALTAMSKFKEGFIFKDIKITIIDFIKGAKKYFVLFLVVLTAFVSTIYYLNDTYILSPKLRQQKLQQEFFEAKINKYAVKGNVLGKEKAKVVINVYSDFNCPFCRVINIMLHKIAREGHVLINEVNYPLDNSCNSRVGVTLGGHELSCIQARYAIASKKQGKYWGVANLFFDKNMSPERPKNEEDIIKLIEEAHLGINIEQLKEDANSDVTKQILDDDIQKASVINVNGTPTLQINDVVYVGAMPYDELKEKIAIAEKREENK